MILIVPSNQLKVLLMYTYLQIINIAFIVLVITEVKDNKIKINLYPLLCDKKMKMIGQKLMNLDLT